MRLGARSTSINLACAVGWTTIAIAKKFRVKYDSKRRDEREVAAREEVAGLSEQEVQDLEWKHLG